MFETKSPSNFFMTSNKPTAILCVKPCRPSWVFFFLIATSIWAIPCSPTCCYLFSLNIICMCKSAGKELCPALCFSRAFVQRGHCSQQSDFPFTADLSFLVSDISCRTSSHATRNSCFKWRKCKCLWPCVFYLINATVPCISLNSVSWLCLCSSQQLTAFFILFVCLMFVCLFLYVSSMLILFFNLLLEIYSQQYRNRVSPCNFSSGFSPSAPFLLHLLSLFIYFIWPLL